MTLSWPNHLLTLDEWAALPEDTALRLELAEGVLVMSPQPFSHHQRAVARLAAGLDGELPRELVPLTEVEVVLTEQRPTVRVPDVVVVSTAAYEANPPRFPASEVLLAVEILSEGTRRVDRVLKFAEYAEAGIPAYWIVDLEPPTSLVAYSLVDGAYETVLDSSGTVAPVVAGHPVTVDLDALIRR